MTLPIESLCDIINYDAKSQIAGATFQNAQCDTNKIDFNLPFNWQSYMPPALVTRWANIGHEARTAAYLVAMRATGLMTKIRDMSKDLNELREKFKKTTETHAELSRQCETLQAALQQERVFVDNKDKQIEELTKINTYRAQQLDEMAAELKRVKELLAKQHAEHNNDVELASEMIAEKDNRIRTSPLPATRAALITNSDPSQLNVVLYAYINHDEKAMVSYELVTFMEFQAARLQHPPYEYKDVQAAAQQNVPGTSMARCMYYTDFRKALDDRMNEMWQLATKHQANFILHLYDMRKLDDPAKAKI